MWCASSQPTAYVRLLARMEAPWPTHAQKAHTYVKFTGYASYHFCLSSVQLEVKNLPTSALHGKTSPKKAPIGQSQSNPTNNQGIFIDSVHQDQDCKGVYHIPLMKSRKWNVGMRRCKKATFPFKIKGFHSKVQRALLLLSLNHAQDAAMTMVCGKKKSQGITR